MANITENRISLVISDTDVTALETAAGQVSTIINANTIALEDDERASLFSLDEANKVFAEEALQEAQANGSILPPVVQGLVPELAKDLTLFMQLDNFENTQINQWLQRVKDTKRLSAHESYKVALIIYGIYEALAKAGVPGAQASYDRLKQRFMNRGGGATPITHP
jgi:hypothetical protein